MFVYVRANHGIFSNKKFWKMSYFRNQLLNYIRNDDELKTFNYTMFFNLDIKGTISIDGLATNFGYLKQGSSTGHYFCHGTLWKNYG